MTTVQSQKALIDKNNSLDFLQIKYFWIPTCIFIILELSLIYLIFVIYIYVCVHILKLCEGFGKLFHIL